MVPGGFIKPPMTKERTVNRSLPPWLRPGEGLRVCLSRAGHTADGAVKSRQGAELLEENAPASPVFYCR
ncbi:hypothetical protein EYF80_066550 [Liparis tanakae]|uniref:Uncharacterized protein n=1 Tax=Liparis tanakae TaxID=230148 RepID=A0A4Z2E3N3_9TELE|nr:hypothetical protein EYF80_066550 [Liparis tanakae]